MGEVPFFPTGAVSVDPDSVDADEGLEATVLESGTGL